MRLNFRRVAAIGASVLLAGMTMGVAAAANFPSPYSSSTSSGVAVVSGSGAGVDDAVATSSISNYLAGQVNVAGGVPTGGDSYLFEKTSTKFHLGDAILDVISTSLDEDEMPNLLADGKFIDDDNDEFDYTQKITMGVLTLEMFEDNDYKEDEPTVGFKITSGTTVLTYKLDFSDEPLLADLETSDLTFMGKSYYILTKSQTGANTILTLLDSASETIVMEDETVTLDVEGTPYSVSIAYISDTETKLTINGETTNSLEEADTQKLSDGAFVGVKDIMYDAKETGISKVEFSIGSGKLKLTSGSEIQLNDDSVSGITATISNTTTVLSYIELAWATDDDEFVTEDSDLTMPAFEAVKLSFHGLDYPAEEVIEVQQGGDLYITLENFPLKNGPADINLIYGTSADSVFDGVGKDADNLLITNYSSPTGLTQNITFDKDTGDYFVASWSDGSDAESYLMRATSFTTESGTDKATIQYYDYNADPVNPWKDKKTGIESGDTFSMGSVDLKAYNVSDGDNLITILNNSIYTHFNKLYSEEGMTVYLPWENSTAHGFSDVTTVSMADDAAACAKRGPQIGELYTGTLTYNHTASLTTTTTTVGCPTFVLKMIEEDKNGNKYGSSGTAGTDYEVINVTLGWDGSANPEAEVSSVAGGESTSEEILDTDVWRDFTYSSLATEILENKPSSGQQSVKLIYHGDEVAASVRINAPETSFGTAEAGTMVFTDAEQTSWEARDVILVGGSCINSATAEVLGVTYPTCESAWTTATGAGSGKYIIQSVGDAFTTGKIALVVAGYAKADTAAAASRLVNQPTTIDTTAGSKYVGIVGVEGTSTITKIA